MDIQHWGVDVRVNGERVLTIESNCLSGISDIEKFGDVIRGCAHHLLAFIGDGKPDDTWELGTTPNTGSPKLVCPECGMEAYNVLYCYNHKCRRYEWG